MHSRLHLFLTTFFLTGAAFDAAGSSGSSSENTPPVELAPVVVSESLDQAREGIVPALGATEFHISALQIAAQSLGPNAAFNQVLLRAPGMAQDSYGQLHLRGEHANLQYRINDVLLPEGISGFGQELDPRFVQSVAVLTGSLPAQYGYRTAGVIDIHTQTGAALPKGGELTLFGGSYDTRRVDAEISGAQDGLSNFFTMSAVTDDIGIESPTAGRRPIHDQTRQFKLFDDFTDIIDSTSRVSLLLSSSFATFQIPSNPGQDAGFTLDGVSPFDSSGLNENQREDNTYAIVAYQKSASGFNFQLSAFTRYSLVKFLPDTVGDLIFNGVASRVHRDIASNGLEADAKWDFASDHTLRVGALVVTENANTRTANFVFPVDADGNQTSSTPMVIADNSHKVGWLYGVYVQDEWKPTSALTINFGTRADTSQAYLNEGQLSPRLNVVWQLNEATSFHVGYSRYFTPPPLELVQSSDLAKFAGTTNAAATTNSPPVRSERSHYFDTGVSRQFGSDFSVTIDGYCKKAVDQLDEGQFGAALIYSPFNYRDGRVTGVELSTNFAHKGFSAYANVARSRALGRQFVSGEFVFGPDEIDYASKHWVHLDHDQALTASTGTAYRFGGNLVYADLLYGSGLRSGFVNTDHLPEYHPMNLGFERAFKIGGGGELRVRIDIVNLFDEVYELRNGSGIGVFAPQFGQRRGFYGGLTWSF